MPSSFAPQYAALFARPWVVWGSGVLVATLNVFLFAFVQSGGTIQFVSDVEGGPILDPVPGPFIDETGTVQDAATVTWTLANGSTVVDTIAFVSDIPEPASAALLCIGLICLGLICGTRARFRLVLRPSSGLRSA